MDVQEMLLAEIERRKTAAPQDAGGPCNTNFPYCCTAHAAKYAEQAVKSPSFHDNLELMRAHDRCLDTILAAGEKARYPHLFSEPDPNFWAEKNFEADMTDEEMNLVLEAKLARHQQNETQAGARSSRAGALHELLRQQVAGTAIQPTAAEATQAGITRDPPAAPMTAFEARRRLMRQVSTGRP